jgi:(1->4)-alpha-D-glucan 1-alpha-D-glucosylmutase
MRPRERPERPQRTLAAHGVEELLLAFPVYRPYVVPGERAPAEAVELLERAAEVAARAFRVPEEAAAVQVVRDLALGALGRSPDKDDFVARFAQVSTAVRAKAVEDTAFYRWFPLLSLNEVGGEPDGRGTEPDEFHAFCARLQRDWPATGTVLSTHDTKRSADVRARIAVLSEAPQEWRQWLADADGAYAHLRAGVPDRHAQYLVWQTLVGAGADPDDVGACPARVVEAVRKSLREAGTRTSWTSPDADYESAVLEFAAAAAQGQPHPAADLLKEHGPSERANVLGAALVHLTMPGAPDVYQGTESLRHTLVDPDNRRPVPFADLAARLARLDDGEPGRDLRDDKLWLTAKALRLRRSHPEWFGDAAGYTPLHAHGAAADHAFSFIRADRVTTVATRLSRALAAGGGWGTTELPLPGGVWTDELTGRSFNDPVPLATLLTDLPVALLVRREG